MRKKLQQAAPEAQPVSIQQPNVTVTRDEPIEGGQTAYVMSPMFVQQTQRRTLDMATYLSALQAAESRSSPNRTMLYDMYTHCLADGHLMGVLNKRLDSVLNKPVFYKNAKGEVVEAMNNNLNSYEFRQVKRLILESIMWGISGLEFIPGDTMEVRSIFRKHIKTKTQLIVRQQNELNSGIDYTKLDNVWIIGEDEDLGLLHSACMYVIYKRNALSDWANFIQIFGMPMRIAYYDAQDKTTALALQATLDSMGSAMALVIPKQAEFKLEDGKTSNANGDLQAQFVDKMDQQISVLILGNTETTTQTGSKGNNAKAQTHQQQQNELLKSDMALLQAYLNDPHFHKIMQSYGWPVVEGGSFEFNKDVDIAFLKDRAEVDKILVEAGVKIGEDYFYETYNLPKPKPDEPIVGAPTEPDGDEPAPTKPKPHSSKPPASSPTQTDLEGPITRNDVLDILRDFFGPAL